eukprot:m.229293 g.229293  ORF g.229293 m.229293 type:complete len:84 (-) comp33557_c6_seq1:571-822(-)
MVCTKLIPINKKSVRSYELERNLISAINNNHNNNNNNIATNKFSHAVPHVPHQRLLQAVHPQRRPRPSTSCTLPYSPTTSPTA